MEDFLKFRKMITPIVIQILFWIGVVVVVILGIIGLSEDFLSGILMIIFGPLAVRIYAELLMVIFKMNDWLGEISESLAEIKYNTRQPRA